jgi:hypothetical protein
MRMLVWGTISPGESDSHTGVYLREKDIESLATSGALLNKPVKIEHQGPSIGRIVSAWRHGDNLDAVLQIDNNSIDAMFGQGFVKSGKCPELSLGYSVAMQYSADGMLSGGYKEVHEVSLVKKGARHDCHIRGWKG